MKIGSICSGVGGLDLGVQAAVGGSVAWFMENDPAPAKIMQHYHPEAENHEDLTEVERKELDYVDVITAGYPCQPFALSGERRGDKDERHLWPHIASAIRSLRPKLTVLENVPGHLSLGFTDVLSDLNRAGYDAEWEIISAASVGAPHIRKRLFILAWDRTHREWLKRLDLLPDTRGQASQIGDRRRQDESPTVRFGRSYDGNREDFRRYSEVIGRWESITGNPMPWPASVGRSGRPKLDPGFVEWMMGVDYGYLTDPGFGLTRSDQLKILGNMVVPQQAEKAVRILLERARWEV